MSRFGPAKGVAAALGAALLAGCGWFSHPQSAPSPRPRQHPATGTPAPGAPAQPSGSHAAFPAAVRGAMRAVAATAGIPLKAPSALPAPPAGKVWAATTTVTPGANYTATLWVASRPLATNSPAIRYPQAVPLASWSGYHAASTAAAQSLWASVSHYTPWLWANQPSTPVTLTGGVAGDMYQLSARPAAPTVPAQPSATVVTFSDRGWRVVVSASPANPIAQSTANQVARRLARQAALPSGVEGSIVVNEEATQPSGQSVTTIVSWQEGQDVYQVQASGTQSAPHIDTALTLAGSMRSFPAGG